MRSGLSSYYRDCFAQGIGGFMEYIGSFAYDRVLLKGDIRLIIYGNGIMGKRLYALLENNDMLDKLECICDAKPELWGKMYRNVLIISPEEAISQKRECHFLTAGKYAEEQVRILQKGGVRNIHMFLEL